MTSQSFPSNVGERGAGKTGNNNMNKENVQYVSWCDGDKAGKAARECLERVVRE